MAINGTNIVLTVVQRSKPSKTFQIKNHHSLIPMNIANMKLNACLCST